MEIENLDLTLMLPDTDYRLLLLEICLAAFAVFRLSMMLPAGFTEHIAKPHDGIVADIGLFGASVSYRLKIQPNIPLTKIKRGFGFEILCL